jgi:site-specific recombinase XerD
MLDRIFCRATVRARIRGNPLGGVLQRYIGHLAARGYCHGAMYQYVYAIEHFGRWLGNHSIDRASVRRFVRRHLPRCQCSGPTTRNINYVRAALHRLLEMLEPEGPTPTIRTFTDRVLRDYEHHLKHVCGLAGATIQCRLRYARSLLRRRGVRRARQLRAWSPAQIAQSISSVGRLYKPSSGQVLACSIRSFLRFLLSQGLIHRDLAAAVPSFATWRLASLPKTIGLAELEDLVAAVDASRPIGMRNRAILLCLTQLGLRAADVASLQVEDVDQASRVLRFRRPKQRDHVVVPMTSPVAHAIDLYARQGRPSCNSSSLFVLHRAPMGQGLSSRGICDIVVKYAIQAGLADRIGGTHIIRHSVATALINQGASIKQVADLLGHRSIDTTAIYAKVDLNSLARVALPWPAAQEVIP